MRNLGGEFEGLKDYPILSAITTNKGYYDLDEYMVAQGFRTKHMWEPAINLKPGMSIQRRERYIVKAYDYPDEYEHKSSD